MMTQDESIYTAASFANRLGARFIDLLIIGIASFVIIVFIMLFTLEGTNCLSSKDIKTIFYFIPIFIDSFIYYPWYESKGGTIGKQYLAMKTVHKHSKLPPTYINSLLRSLIKFGFSFPLIYALISGNLLFIIITSVIFLFPYFTVFISTHKQTLYDLFTKVIVQEIYIKEEDILDKEDDIDYDWQNEIADEVDENINVSDDNEEFDKNKKL